MIGVFGSTVRGEARKDGDIDLLVRFSKRKSLPAVVRLEGELIEALGSKVDLLTEGALSLYSFEGRIPRHLWRENLPLDTPSACGGVVHLRERILNEMRVV